MPHDRVLTQHEISEKELKTAYLNAGPWEKVWNFFYVSFKKK